MNAVKEAIKAAVTRIWKAIGAAVGGLAGTQVDWFSNTVLGVDWPSEVDGSIAVLLAALGAALAPKNKIRGVPDTPPTSASK